MNTMNTVNKYIMLLFIVLAIAASFAHSALSNANSAAVDYGSSNIQDAVIAQSHIIIPINKKSASPTKVLKFWITAYSSTIDQTDDSPFITASGSYVREGVAAANILPFGTKFKLPEIFGDQIFVIEDRMHSRYQNRIDIWFADRGEATDFGKKWTKVEIL